MKYRIFKKIPTGIFIFYFLLLFLIGNSVYAEGELDPIGIMPYTEKAEGGRPWFIYDDVMPGTLIKDTVTVSNSSDRSVDVVVYPVDARNAPDGGYAPNADDAPVVDSGKWIKLDTSRLTLGPKERKNIDFTITVPKQVAVGDHAATILIHRDNSSPDGAKIKDIAKNSTIEIVVRMGTRVYLNIHGPVIKKFTFNKLQFKKDTAGKPYFDFDLQNDGNMRLSFTANVLLYDKDGNLVQNFNKNLGEILPFSKVNVTRLWENPLLGNGSLSANAIVRANGIEEAQSQETSFELDKNPDEKNAFEIFFGNNMSKTLLLIVIILLIIIVALIRRNHSTRKM